MGRKYNDISGEVYDDLEVIGPSHNDGRTFFWKLKCLKCGDKGFAQSSDLRRGRRNFCPTCNDKRSKKMPYRCLFGNYRRGAEKRDLTWKLTFDEFMGIVHSNCFYCDRPPAQTLWKEGWLNEAVYNGIDRIENDVGYRKSNCVPCCKYCNMAKSRWTAEEFILWLNFIRDNHNRRTVISNKEDCVDTVIRAAVGDNYRKVDEFVVKQDRYTSIELTA